MMMQQENYLELILRATSKIPSDMCMISLSINVGTFKIGKRILSDDLCAILEFP